MKKTAQFSDPCNSAYQRMKTILFRPFNAGKWFVLGFSAWLATLGEGGGGGGSSYQGNAPSSGTESGEDGESAEYQGLIAEFEEASSTAMQWIQENPWVIGVAILAILFILALMILFCWLSSRGKFMFLDNVVHNRAEVKLPWSEYRAEGNSLFRWAICFHIVTAVVLLALLAGTGFWLFSQFSEAETFTGSMVITGISATVVFLLILLIIGYIWTLLTHFVVPQMYKHRITALAAWRNVMSLQRERAGALFVFFILQFLLGLASLLIILAFGLATCCVGLLAMAIPYLGAVITLPISVFFCALGPEFSRQFGSKFDLWSDSPPHIESA